MLFATNDKLAQTIKNALGYVNRLYVIIVFRFIIHEAVAMIAAFLIAISVKIVVINSKGSRN